MTLDISQRFLDAKPYPVFQFSRGFAGKCRRNHLMRIILVQKNPHHQAGERIGLAGSCRCFNPVQATELHVLNRIGGNGFLHLLL